MVLVLTVSVIVLAAMGAYGGLPALGQGELGDPECGWFLYGQTGDGLGDGAEYTQIIEGAPANGNTNQVIQVSEGDSYNEVHQYGGGSRNIDQVIQSPGGEAWWE